MGKAGEASHISCIRLASCMGGQVSVLVGMAVVVSMVMVVAVVR